MSHPRSHKVGSNFDQKLITWIESQDVGICFNGNGWNHGYDLLAGVGVKSRAQTIEQAFQLVAKGQWVFAHLGYDLKNELEKLDSSNPDSIGFPESFFFEPTVVFQLSGDQLTILTADGRDTDQLLHSIESVSLTNNSKLGMAKNRISHEQYISDIDLLQDHMQRGDIYQANYCQEFYWEDLSFSTSTTYREGFKSNPNPFSAYYKLNEHHCVCLSPERFIQIKDGYAISQPMKGTAARDSDPEKDLNNLTELKNSEKDRRENVMIVDLVRNDLSHFAKKGSVRVPDLYKLESYPKVHQMYSSVTAELVNGINPLHVLLKAFPMGSMTGAPKIRAMQLLEEIEHTKRGLFSGTIGYFTPEGNADFNVVIRSLIYNRSTRTLSCHAGGGITALSDPELEYEETFIKAQPLLDLIQ